MGSWWDNIVWYVVGSPLLHDEPIFHRRDPDGPYTYGAGKANLSRCGRVIDHWADGRAPHWGIPAKREHADRIGRPCMVCFPEEYTS